MNVLKEINYDTAVIGGGVAGICVGITSAKCGAKTIIIEKQAVLGGMCTSGMITVWCGGTKHGFLRSFVAKRIKKGKEEWFMIPKGLRYISLKN